MSLLVPRELSRVGAVEIVVMFPPPSETQAMSQISIIVSS